MAKNTSTGGGGGATHAGTNYQVALAFTGVNGTEDRALADKVMIEHQETWRAEWLRLRGLPEWARHLQTYPAGELEREFARAFRCGEARAVGMV